MYNSFGYWLCNIKFAPTLILRGGAVVARWAHNPKVGGSNPPSATKKKPWCESTGDFCFWIFKSLLLKIQKQKDPSDAEGG
jgi:hypothetical protein